MSHDTEPIPKTNIETPSAADLKDQAYPEQKARTDRWGRGKQVGAAAVIGGVVFGGGALVMSQLSNHNGTPNNTEPTHDAPAVPGQVGETAPAQSPNPSQDPTNPANTITSSPEATQNGEQLTVDQLEIKAGLSDEELGQTLMQRLEAWENAGSPKDSKAEIYTRGSIVGFNAAAQELVDKTGQTFADSLMASGWQNDPLAVEFVDTMKVRNNSTILGANVALGKKEAPLVDTYTYKNATPVELSPSDPAVHFDRALQVDYVWTNSKTGETGPMRATFGLITDNGQERIVEVHIVVSDTGQKVVG